ncbi:MAG: hypothetical protein ACFE0J_22035 [Elainellaceae cyanobacterium]
MPAKGRIEVKIKFNGIPLTSSDSRRGFTQIEVICDNYTVSANVKTKTFERFLMNARILYEWEGALVGTLHHIQGHQIILSGAGLQCYEKKS